MADQRAWLEVDVAALQRNARRLADRLGPVRMLPMVKADGYGLGAVRVARALRTVDPWGLGVASLGEGRSLREAGVEGRIVVFADCAPSVGPALLTAGLEPALLGPESLPTWRAAAEGAGPVPAHLEVDTGMSRSGFRAERVGEWLPAIEAGVREGWLRLESTFTHFHSAETDRAATLRQWERFETTLSAMTEAGVDPGLRHAANSAAILRHPETHADVVRPGLFLYGGSAPGAGTDASPEPVARLRARVLDVREVPRGATASYGATWEARRPTRLATLGIGYGDGLRRGISGRGSAIVNGRRAPIVGMVCMDMTLVDVTDVGEVAPGDVATLLGPDGEVEIRLRELADAADTIEYEVLTGFGVRLPRRERSSATGRPGGGRRRAAV